MARFATFDAGFAFGRTGWGTTRPFEDEVMWSARFGPGRAFHGHLDHGAVTLYGYGQRLVDDPGLFTLNNNRWRAVCDQSGLRTTSSQSMTRPTQDRPGPTLPQVGYSPHARRHHDPRSGLQRASTCAGASSSRTGSAGCSSTIMRRQKPSGTIASSGICSRAPIQGWMERRSERATWRATL